MWMRNWKPAVLGTSILHSAPRSRQRTRSRRDRDQLLSLLPASYRKESGDLAAHPRLALGRGLALTAAGVAQPALARPGDLGHRADGHASRLDDGEDVPQADISHESDFRIAQEKHLLPPEVSWPAWRIFVEQLDTEHVYARVDPRFQYGELRLSRLNKIYAFTQTPLRGYVRRWNQYGTFFHDNFAWLASASLYIVIVLTAMQVGLATQSLGRNDAFQAASYGFTVFSILGPLIAVSLIVIAFCCIFVCNWMKADAAVMKPMSSVRGVQRSRVGSEMSIQLVEHLF
ncbi:hypothetical protein HIM_10494 [Hirsutella minnesotensis 3608]|uniref:Uncharacterized protein n=1 Tax=Hirsutella minnesotensis 3608 TaxID=1043627 RepID=A0A0F8A287_9HYPO|nr:hypothetical protein HIM_10494 [Hirsutella minnesotensis 3608]